MLIKMTSLSHMGRSSPKWPIKRMVMKAEPNIKVPNHEAISVAIEVANAIGDELTTIASEVANAIDHDESPHVVNRVANAIGDESTTMPMKLPMPLVKVHKLLTLKLRMSILVKVYNVLPLKLPIP